MTQIFKNNATSRLVLPMAQVDTSLRLLPGEGERFPQPVAPDFFLVTVEDRRTGQIEICRCVDRQMDILNVVRAQEGTNVQEFAIGATVSNRITAATLQNYITSTFTKVEADPLYVNVTGDVMTGTLQLKYALGTDPVAATEAVNKDYVDRRFQAAIVTGMSISDTPPVAPYHGQLWWESDSGNMFIWYVDANSAQWVQVNIDSSALSAPINSPAFTGDPTAPTPPLGDNDQSIATTAFVKGQNYITAAAVPPAETGATILAKLITVDGASSSLDADLLDGLDGTFYRSATNLNAGTINSARLPGRLMAFSNTQGNIDLNAAIESGWYMTQAGVPNGPEVDTSGFVHAIRRFDHIIQFWYRSSASSTWYWRWSGDVGATWTAWARMPDPVLLLNFNVTHPVWSVSSSSGAPSVGSIRSTTSVAQNVVALNISNTDTNGFDRTTKLMKLLKLGAQILIEDTNPSTDWVLFKVTGAATDGGVAAPNTYTSVPVAYISGGQAGNVAGSMPSAASLLTIIPAPAP